MSGVKLLSPILFALFSIVGASTANAQIFCNGTNGCPSGYTQIEVTNDVGCDYELTFHVEINGVPSQVTCGVGANSTLVVCYDASTTQIGSVYVQSAKGGDITLNNPGHPGTTSGAVSKGGCTGGDTVTWDNDTSTGPGHVTNIIIEP